MTESVSVPNNAQMEPEKQNSGWEYALRCLVLLLGLFLGLVVAVMIAAVLGWFQIDC